MTLISANKKRTAKEAGCTLNNLLTREDNEYLQGQKLWIRSSLEFSVLRKTPDRFDVVLFKKGPLPFHMSEKHANTFVSFYQIMCSYITPMVALNEQESSELSPHDEDHRNYAYLITESLNDEDGKRLIAYLEHYQEELEKPLSRPSNVHYLPTPTPF
ncbi:MAG: hypothetical protein KUG81_09265 [Gammaproteobacteria bacterium]|nr:hypothetical protein [Gammaproteobacteria bacterium]